MSAQTELRSYQVSAIDLIREAYNKGARKVLLQMSTGAGKTVIFCYILNKLKEEKVKAFMTVRGRKLVDQASKRLIREDVAHGVLMANHWKYQPYERIQICSIDTIFSRGYHAKAESCRVKCNGLHLEAEMIIIDEAHFFATDSAKDFISKYPDALFLSVTATPFGPDLSHLADAVVKPITMQELVDDGYLVPPRYFCPYIPDLSGVKTQAGEYNQRQLAEALDKSELIGNVVEHYLKIGEGRPFLCFCVTVDHSQHMAAKFRESGLNVVHCDADTPDKEREETLLGLERGTVHGITNVNIFATGVDLPFLPCVIQARATKSYNLYLQQLGRGTRAVYADGFDLSTRPGRLAAIAAGPKQNFIVLDHAGNVLRHGFINEEREASVGQEAKDFFGVKTELVNGGSINTCYKCFIAFRGPLCPNGCPPMKAEIKEENEGELEEITDLTPEELYIRRLKIIVDTKLRPDGTKYKRGWMFYKFRDRFGEEKAQIYFPKKFVPEFVRAKLLEKKAAEFFDGARAT